MSTNNNQRTQNTSTNAGASQQPGQSQNTGSANTQNQQRQNALAHPTENQYQQRQVYSGAGGYGQQAVSQPVQGTSIVANPVQSASSGQQSQYRRDFRFRAIMTPNGPLAATGYGQAGQNVASQPVQGTGLGANTLQMQSVNVGQQSQYRDIRFRDPMTPSGQQNVGVMPSTSAPGMGAGGGSGSTHVFHGDPIQQNRGRGRPNRGAGAAKPSRGRRG